MYHLDGDTGGDDEEDEGEEEEDGEPVGGGPVPPGLGVHPHLHSTQYSTVQYHQVWVYSCTVHPHLAQQRRAGRGVAGDRGVEQLGRVHRQVAVLLLHLTTGGVFSFTNTVMIYLERSFYKWVDRYIK